MHIILESVLMLSTEYYQNWSMLVEAIQLAKVGAFFETQCILFLETATLKTFKNFEKGRYVIEYFTISLNVSQWHI